MIKKFRCSLFQAMTGMALVEEQAFQRGNEDDRIFPYNHKSAGTAFTRENRRLAFP